MSPSPSGAAVGDAVADDLVDRRADALRVAVVVERAGIAAVADARVVAHHVEVVGRDAGGDRLPGLLQDLGRGAAGPPQAGDLLVGLDEPARCRARACRSGRSRAGRSRAGPGGGASPARAAPTGRPRPARGRGPRRRPRTRRRRPCGSACTCDRCRTSTDRWTWAAWSQQLQRYRPLDASLPTPLGPHRLGLGRLGLDQLGAVVADVVDPGRDRVADQQVVGRRPQERQRLGAVEPPVQPRLVVRRSRGSPACGRGRATRRRWVSS